MSPLRLCLAGSAACALGVWAGLSLSQVVPQPGPPTPIAGAYNLVPPTLTTAQAGWIQLDNAGNLKVNVAVGGGTGGTASSFGAAFPATGTAIGFTDGTNMVAGKVDGSQNLLVNCATGCSGGTFNNNADNVATSATNGQAAAWNYVWDGAAWDRLYGDSTNGAFVNVKTSVLPTGAATAANQATEIASLATIASNTGAAIPAQAGTIVIGGVNVAAINNVTPLMGNGATGTGSPRFTLSNDNTIPTGWPSAANQTAWQSATGAAPPANAAYLGANGSGATGGQLRGLITCDSHAKYDASDNGSITLVTGVSGRKVYVCGYLMATGGTATNLKLREGSDANCATNGADLTPAWQLVANDKVGAASAFWTGLVVSTNAYYVCINASAGNAHQAEIWYTIL